MSKKEVFELSYEEIESAVEEHGSERRAAIALNIPRTTLQDRRKKLKEERFSFRKVREPLVIDPDPDKVLRFIFSSAQDQTDVDEVFFANLQAYAAHVDAQIFISGFTYNKSLFEEHSSNKAFYHPLVRPHLTEHRIHLGPSLAFCGEMNTLPTATRPLSGFETYTKERWGIFPHPKIQLVSIPTAKMELAKIIMTTGAVTLPNYVQKKAGIKAEHYHELGALIVEVLPDGRFFCRHLLADDDGGFYDLVNYVKDGKVTQTNSVEAWNAPDVHVEKLEPTMASAIWGYPEQPDFVPLVDHLKPSFQFLHDVQDFDKRSHHNVDDPHFIYEMFIKNNESVEEGIEQVGKFLLAACRPETTTVIVESNHDLALLKWLKKVDYRKDPVNAAYFLKLQQQCYKAISEGDDEFQILSWALKDKFDLEDVLFLREDDSFTVAGNIECAMHGHLGANGARPSPGQFARIGRKSNTGHRHAAVIEDGNYGAGALQMDMKYNKGLSSWSVTGIITYGNGKRTLITLLDDGLYCAEMWELFCAGT